EQRSTLNQESKNMKTNRKPSSRTSTLALKRPAPRPAALATSRSAGERRALQPDGQERLSPDLLRKMDAYWRAANYLSVGQIYLMANPLLKRPLKRQDIKPRL